MEIQAEYFVFEESEDLLRLVFSAYTVFFFLLQGKKNNFFWLSLVFNNKSVGLQIFCLVSKRR